MIWLFVWRRLYALPENHPRITAAEKQLILGDGQPGTTTEAAIPIRKLLALPRTWGTIVARSFTDPVWFFIADWFPIYLMSKGISVVGASISVWIPFIAADLGNFFGGWLSGYFIGRRWPLLWARKAVVILGGIGVLTIIPTVFTTNIVPITCLFAVATFVVDASPPSPTYCHRISCRETRWLR